MAGPDVIFVHELAETTEIDPKPPYPIFEVVIERMCGIVHDDDFADAVIARLEAHGRLNAVDVALGCDHCSPNAFKMRAVTEAPSAGVAVDYAVPLMIRAFEEQSIEAVMAATEE